MKKYLNGILITAFIIFTLISCYYDSEEDLYPVLTGPCDTLNVTFSGRIASILKDNCLSCHSNANSQFGGGVRLESIEDVRTRSGSILPAINHTGRVPMPPSGKLSECSIDMFSIWVKNGMPE